MPKQEPHTTRAKPAQGTELDLVIDDAGDSLDEAERAALHAAIRQAWASFQGGEGRLAPDVLADLAKRRALRGQAGRRSASGRGADPNHRCVVAPQPKRLARPRRRKTTGRAACSNSN